MTFSPSDDDFDKFVKIFSNTDESMKEIGQILKTPTSRKIYKILQKQSCHTKEIGKILEGIDNPRLPNLLHHLKKMTRVGLLQTDIRIKNGHALTYYSAIKILIIVSENNLQTAKNSADLRNTIKNVFQLGAIALIPTIISITSYDYFGMAQHEQWFGMLSTFDVDYTRFLIGSVVFCGSLFGLIKVKFFQKLKKSPNLIFNMS